jgi:hypothetical protein
LSRQQQELWREAMQAVNVKIVFRVAKWLEQLKASRADKPMMWGVAWGCTFPDRADCLNLLYGPNKGQAKHARFDLPAFNALYQRQSAMIDGPEREDVMRQAKALAVSDMPYKVTGRRIATDLLYRQVQGYNQHSFVCDWWHYVDLDAEARQP